LTVGKAPYLDGKQFAYSVTYDEALEDLFRETIPIHEEYGVPANLSVVVGQMGQLRNLPGSSFHGMRHMTVGQLREMLSRGWTVSSHSWSHGNMHENTYQEVVRSREVLEETLGAPITAFIVPGSNQNHPPVVPVARENGYLSVYTVTDGINTHESDVFALNRSFMNEEGFDPIFHQYDPYRWLHWAKERNGWIVEYTHRATREFLSRQKEISVENLRRRFEKVKEVGGDAVWLTPPEAVVDYILVSRHTEIVGLRAGADRLKFGLSVKALPKRVQRRQLTFVVRAPGWAGRAMVRAGGESVRGAKKRGQEILFNLAAKDGLNVEVTMSPVGGGRKK
jgi:peptidoglycan/xylan/chitin deacetylase (PgdA/CDA1 family)